MRSIYQWVAVTTICAVLGMGLHRSTVQIVTDIGWITASFVVAEVIWAVWLFITSSHHNPAWTKTEE